MNPELVAVLMEVERHVGALGWDQPARLFALVRTSELLAAEPSLAEHLSAAPSDGYSSIEQDDFRAGDDLAQRLAQISWPLSVPGCALVVERAFLPASAEAELPEDPQAASAVVAGHPERLDLRVVAGVTRAGEQHCVARIRGKDADLLSGADLVPALTAALARTLE